MGKTLEDLIREGGRPLPDAPAAAPPKRRYTLEELQAAGARPLPDEVPKAKVGGLETFLNDAADALPLGRPLVNLASTGAMQLAKALGVGEASAKLTPEARAELERAGERVDTRDNVIPGPLDTYRDMRDTRDARTDAGQEQNPWAGRLGTGFGVALTALAPLPKGLGGAGKGGAGAQALRAVASKSATGLGKAMLTGAKLGALQAAGDSRADLTRVDENPWDVAHQGLDTGLGALAGAGGGALGHGVAKAAPPVARFLGRKLEELGLKQGRRVLLNGADSLTKNVTSDEAVREALNSGAILPFGTTQGAANRLGKLRAKYGAVYNDIVARLEAQGIQGPEAQGLADEMLWRAVDEFANTGADKATAKTFQKEAGNVVKLVGGEAGDAMRAPEGARLGLTQAENIKRALQEPVNYSPLVSKSANEAKKDAASIVRRQVEEAIAEQAQRYPQGSEVADLAEDFVPIKQKLGRLIEAGRAAERGAQKEANRSTFGLKETLLASSATDPLTGGALALAGRFMNNRGASAGSAGAYWTGQLAKALANGAEYGAARGALPAGSRAVAAGARDWVDEWLATQPLLPEGHRADHRAALLRRGKK